MDDSTPSPGPQAQVTTLFPPPRAEEDVPPAVQLAAEVYVRALGTPSIHEPPVATAGTVLLHYFDRHIKEK